MRGGRKRGRWERRGKEKEIREDMKGKRNLGIREVETTEVGKGNGVRKGVRIREEGVTKKKKKKEERK